MPQMHEPRACDEPLLSPWQFQPLVVQKVSRNYFCEPAPAMSI